MEKEKFEIKVLPIYSKLAEELIGFFGRTKEEVFEKCIQNYFTIPETFKLLERFESWRNEKLSSSNLEPPLEVMIERMERMLEFSDHTPIEFTLRYLKCSQSWFYDHLHILAEKLGFTLQDQRIVRNKND